MQWGPGCHWSYRPQALAHGSSRVHNWERKGITGPKAGRCWGRPKGSGLAENDQEAVRRRSWPSLNHPRAEGPGALTPCPTLPILLPPTSKVVVRRVNPIPPGLCGHLQLYSIEATHSHLEKPVSPKHPRYPKVVQAARHVAERDPIQEESAIISIHYERPSAGLQREGPCSAKLWSCGSQPLPKVEKVELDLPIVLLFSLHLSPLPDLILPHRTQPASILSFYLGQQQRQDRQQQGGKAERLLGSHGANRAPLARDGNPTVTWWIPGRKAQRARRRKPPQIARLAWTLSSPCSHPLLYKFIKSSTSWTDHQHHLRAC